MKKHSAVYLVSAPLMIAVLTVLDQLSKKWAVESLRGTAGKPFIPGILKFSYVENRGMAFGLMQDARTAFIILTVLTLGLLAFAYLYLPEVKKFRPLSLGLVFIFAGAVGNFIDRVKLGYVVDFLELDFMQFPVFNLADCFVTWTAVILVLLLLFRYKESDLQEIGL